MVTENKDAIKCGDCGVENPRSRVTCQVCHAPLYKKADKVIDKPKDVPVIKGKEKETPKSGKIQTKMAATNPFEDSTKPSISTPTKDKDTTSTPPINKREVHRKAKRKSKVPINEQYFKLEGDILTPVDIGLKVKALKKNQAKGRGKSLIALWTHNKLLIQE